MKNKGTLTWKDIERIVWYLYTCSYPTASRFCIQTGSSIYLDYNKLLFDLMLPSSTTQSNIRKIFNLEKLSDKWGFSENTFKCLSYVPNVRKA